MPNEKFWGHTKLSAVFGIMSSVPLQTIEKKL